MFKGFLSRRLSYFLMILFIILNSILIYFDIFYLLVLPLVILFGYLFIFRLDLIFLAIVFCTPLSFNFENLDLLGIGFYFPTEPMLLAFTVMFLFKALYVKSFKEVISFGKKIGKLLVITRGEKGSIAIKDDEVIECESKKNLNIVDLTGAGDLFAAGFLHGLINNFPIKESLKKGTEMSSKIIQKIGARLN